MNRNFIRLGLSLALVLSPVLTALKPVMAEDKAPAEKTEEKKKAAAVDPKFKAQMDAYLSDDANVKVLASAIEQYFQKKSGEDRKKQEEAMLKQLDDQFKNPVKVDAGKSPVIGKPDAKVTIIEFSDFQCPYCKRGFATMKEIMKAYPDDVKIVFKQLPLEFHENAKPAAMAALAANEQGKFWEMHDLLFENQEKLGPDLFPTLAQQLGLDMEKFKKDSTREDLAKVIDEESKLGASLGIQGTPGFFVNGVAVKGAYPAPFFKQLIDRWLKELKK